MKVRLTLPEGEVSATLDDTATARDLAALLPVTLDMHDLLGREKPGPLPRALDESTESRFEYQVGQIAYWPPDHDLAVFYADDGIRSIPSPGIIVLGTVDDGLDLVAAAGPRFRMTVSATR